MIYLDFHTTDLEEIALVRRYWAMDEAGKYIENVTDLLPFRELKLAAQLNTYMRTIEQVTDHNQQCPTCGKFQVVATRSQVKRRAHVMRYKCNSCIANERSIEKAQQQQKLDELSAFLASVQEQRDSMRTEFAEQPADIILLLMALDDAINPRLARAAFRETECSALAPSCVDRFIKKLRDARVIIDHPSLSSAGAYELEGAEFGYYPNRVTYKLVPDPMLSTEDTLNLVRSMELSDSSAVRNLWLDYATADCMAYLTNQSEFHGLSVLPDVYEEFYSATRVALQTYSVAKIWNVIWRIVRDALALAARDYSNKSKAAATLPGKLRRHLEKVKRGVALPLKDWDRPDWQAAGTLGKLFAEIYSIDETTPGAEVMALFADPVSTDETIDPGNEALRLSADHLFSAAIMHDMAAEALISLANGVKEGLDVTEAITRVFKQIPSLNDPY